MIVMALDHVRDFIHRAAMSFNPADLTRTTPPLFMTRWITHFCAPVFMFTAGLGAFLWWHNKHSKARLSRFLLTRGLWLIVLELTVMRLAYNFNYSPQEPILLLVFWVIGICMIALAALAWLPIRWLAILSVATIALHNCLDNVNPGPGLWNVIHRAGAFQVADHIVVVGYPLVPWIAVMAAGFCCGQVFLMEQAARRRILLTIGIAATVAFLVIRTINIYGDPFRWSTQKSAIFTVLSFLNTTKYPPSLAFLLMTLGPALIVLAWFDRISFQPANPLIVFGRVPMFYFILHFYLAHLTEAFLAFLRYGSASFAFLFHPISSMGGAKRLFPADFGFDLWVAYVVWAFVVVSLYPLCRWFAHIKATRRDWWLSYL